MSPSSIRSTSSLLLAVVLVSALPAAAQTDAVSLKSTDTGSAIPRLVVTTSTGVGALANVRIEQSRFYLGTNAIFQLGTYTPATPGAGDVRYSGGNVLYHDSAVWQTLMQLGPNSPQASSSANPAIYVNETNAGSPDLMHLQVGGASRFRVVNSGSFTAFGDGLPSGNNSLDLGSSTLAWNEAYVGGSISFGTGATRTALAYAVPSAARTITLPNATGTVLLDTTASGNFVSSIAGGNGITPTAASTGAVTLGLSSTSTDSASYVMNQSAGLQGASFRVSGTGELNGNGQPQLNVHTGSTTGGTAVNALSDGASAAGWNIGVYGTANNGGGQNYGVYGETSTSGGKGVYGRFAGTGNGQGLSASNGATGTGSNYAVFAQVNGSPASGSKYGVYGQTLGTATSNYGVYGDAQGSGTTHYGVYGRASGGGTNWAGYFDGNVRVANTYTLEWGTSRAQLSDNQGGSIELGGNGTVAGGGTAFVDFHYSGLTQDFNTRLINSASERLDVQSNTGGTLLSVFGTSADRKLEVFGDIKQRNTWNHTVVRTLPTTVNNYIELGNVSFSAGGAYCGTLWITVAAGTPYPIVKSYVLPVAYAQSGGVWQIVIPTGVSAYAAGYPDDFDLDIYTTGGVAYLRLRTAKYSLGLTAYVTIRHDGATVDTWTETSATGATAAPTTFFTGSSITTFAQASTTGYVGIGLLNPAHVLDVKGNVVNTAPSQGYVALSGDLSGYPVDTYPTLKTSGNYLYFDAGGTYTGYIGYNTGFIDVSDGRLKKNVKAIPGALQKLTQINGVTFEWTDERDKGKSHMGVIAQDVEKVAPELVCQPEGMDTKGVFYGGLNALTIEAIKELNEKVERLEAEIAELKRGR